ncbi:SufS family cysteine desulfurase [Motiliproteus sp. SC1-56]|uniref:SufS family cysteine desulfurase n=1 Tax=Motiliproteus sp. SC1-56 TaxID=2799565 RepID=UPI001A8DA52A|nr:SufS family cysteine desulfurase [Motiliproteus sp. SC1-56]
MTRRPSPPPFDVTAVRQDFPLIGGQAHCYLDNGATTQKPRCVIDSLSEYYRGYNANVHRAAHRLSAQATEAFEQARKQVQGFINAAQPQEIIWTRGTTEAINLVAASYGEHNVGPGDEILVSLMEHHSNIVPWQLLAQRRGAHLRVIPLTEGGDIDTRAFSNLLNERTRLVALTQVSNALGTVNPVAELTRLAQAAGARVLVDGAQAVAHFGVDVQQLGCDFYAFSGHKLFGPTGIGVLYGKEALLEVMPPWQAGGEMIERVSFEHTTFNRLPFKFEAGTPNIGGAIALGRAIGYLESLDRPGWQAHEERLTRLALARLSAVPGVRIIGAPARRAAVIPFVLEGMHSADLGVLLDRQGIAIRTGHHCAMPLMEHLGLPGTARASLALYNTDAEVERLAQALESQQRAAAQPSAPLAAKPLYQQLGALKGWDARYRWLMKLGKNLPPLPDNARTEKNRLHGCDSQVWLVHEFDVELGAHRFRVDSDARIIRALGELMVEALQGLSAEQIVDFDMTAYFTDLGLLQHLSQSRNNGLHALMRAIQGIAAQYHD